jgi:hypothetical protein
MVIVIKKADYDYDDDYDDDDDDDLQQPKEGYNP